MAAILTTHTGSLPRPEALKRLYLERSRGQPADPDEIDVQAAAAVREMIRRQRTAGIDIINDGEQQRDQFFRYIQRRMSGFGGSWSRRVFADLAEYPAFKAMEERIIGKDVVSHRDGLPQAVAEVRYVDPGPINRECASFRAALKETGNESAASFMTAPSPGLIARGMQNLYYDSERTYLEAIGDAVRIEYEAIVRHGFHLQIDAPDLALERHVTYQDRPLNDFLDFVDSVIQTINAALRNVPRDKVRLHVCWGNYEGPHHRDVELRAILPILRKAKVGGFVLPFANGRHCHEYRCLQETPLDHDQFIVAGVIDVYTNVIEHPEAVADRLERVARAVGDPSRVIAGTDCGFETSTGRRRVTEEVAWAKLRSLSEGARLASRRLS